MSPKNRQEVNLHCEHSKVENNKFLTGELIVKVLFEGAFKDKIMVQEFLKLLKYGRENEGSTQTNLTLVRVCVHVRDLCMCECKPSVVCLNCH